MRHCLINLITDAIKYSPENSAIDLTTRFTGNDCELSIADHGMGIPAADQAGLFEPFFRAHNVIAIKATGLSLNIVKHYTELMHGHISFESKELRAATFKLTFPAYWANKGYMRIFPYFLTSQKRS
ncbi:sensor histidine kinase [Mucilaginibacter litoreus]|uniref:histidine kinase n=1 Tax=Mucilaginibacter litoreus TaxID=1048221 RepID=A0ABW3AWH4_9SPHI